jgi:hypothetical protein
MAFDLLNLVWSHRGLKPLQKLVLLRIADRVGSSRTAFAGVQSLADDCGLSHQGVRNIVDKLIADDYLQVEANAYGRKARVFRVNAEMLASNGVAHEVDGEQPGCSQGAREQPDCSHSDGNVSLGNGSRAAAPDPASNGAESREQRREGSRATGLPPTVITVQENQRENQKENHRDAAAPRARYHSDRNARRAHPLDEAPVLEAWSVEACDRFLAAYPQKQGRVPALRAWQALDPDQDLAENIIAVVQHRVRLGWASELQFVPWPGRFLEERRWQEPWSPAPKPMKAYRVTGSTLHAAAPDKYAGVEQRDEPHDCGGPGVAS